MVMEGFPGAGRKIHLLRHAAARYKEVNGLGHGATYGPISLLSISLPLLSAGQANCHMLDFAAKWPGRQRPPLPQKAATLAANLQLQP